MILAPSLSAMRRAQDIKDNTIADAKPTKSIASLTSRCNDYACSLLRILKVMQRYRQLIKRIRDCLGACLLRIDLARLVITLQALLAHLSICMRPFYYLAIVTIANSNR